MSKVALVVHSCDGYEFLYKGFESFFSRYWDFNIPCNLYFATEEKKVEIKGFTNILSGKGQWSDRLKEVLQQIPENYILYFQEDMWLTKAVNKHFFEQLFAIAENSGWQQVKLHSSEVYKTEPTDFTFEGFTVGKVNNGESDFLMSHQVTLWNKQFLIDQLAKGEHPWRNERKGTRRLKKLNPKIYQIDYFAENGKPEINRNSNPAKRSEYFTVSVNGTLSEIVLPFVKILATGSNEEQAYANDLLHHYENKLTHDGKPKPRKEDIFKKLKNWLRSK